MNLLTKSLSLLCLFIVSCRCDELLEYFQAVACNDWHPYKNEKCFKIFQDSGLKTFDDALSLCRENKNSSLLTISSEEENKVLTNLVLKSKFPNDFWIGMRFNNISRSFKWIDQSQWRYKNWDSGYPKNNSGECVQVDVDESVGKWKNRACWKNKLVVCQRMQSWSLEKMQQTVMQVVRDLKEIKEKLNQTTLNLNQTKLKLSQSEEKLKINDKVILELNKKLKQSEDKLSKKLNEQSLELKETKTKINETSKSLKEINSEMSRVEKEQKQKNELMTKDIEKVKKELNKVPLGFIYFQLPDQPPPAELWQDLKWSDISSSLSGVFFRVLGGNSSEFGQVQEDFSPRIVRTETLRHDGTREIPNWHGVDHFPVGAGTIRWTGYQGIHDCGNSCSGHYWMRFKISDGEVRPKNVAIRVWKRVE